MTISLGLKAHSGWAVLVAVGFCRRNYHILDRRRIELIKDDVGLRAKQPYHAAQGLRGLAATNFISRSVEAAYRSSVREIRAALDRSRELDHEIVACVVLAPDPMPDWSTDEILAVHLRMHKAEGVLFPNALIRGARACGLNVVTIPEKQLSTHAERSLTTPINNLMKKVETLGKSVGAPWGKDQKIATLAAMIGLHP